MDERLRCVSYLICYLMKNLDRTCLTPRDGIIVAFLDAWLRNHKQKCGRTYTPEAREDGDKIKFVISECPCFVEAVSDDRQSNFLKCEGNSWSCRVLLTGARIDARCQISCCVETMSSKRAFASYLPNLLILNRLFVFYEIQINNFMK